MRAVLRRAVIATLTLATAAMLVGGCGSGDSSSSASTTRSGDSSGGSSASGSGGLVIMVGAPSPRPLFAAAQRGASDAAKVFGLQLQYTSPKDLKNFVPDYSQLVEQATGRHPAALVVADFVPSAFDPLIKRATQAGIPTVVFNSGQDAWKADGAVGFVGEDAVANGRAAGAAAQKAGAHHVVCVNTAPANPVTVARCAGVKAAMEATGGGSDELKIPLADTDNPSALAQDIQGFLASHSDTDHVVTLGTGAAVAALAAVDKAGKAGKVSVGTFDLSGEVIDAVKNGKMKYAIDQQPYLQGYYSVQIAAQYMKYKLHPTGPVTTTGFVIDASNIQDILAVKESDGSVLGAG